MKKILLLFVSALLCNLSMLAQTSLSKWQSGSIIIDGDASDWTTIPRFFNSDSKIQYEFRNDAQNLYLVLQTSDRATLMQMKLAGFSLRFKVKAEKVLKSSIIFPTHKMGEMKPDEFQQEGNNKLVGKSEMRPKMNFKDSAIVEGFLISNGIVVSDNIQKDNICFASNKGGHEKACYEVQVPLKQLFGATYSIEKINATPIQLYVSINGLSKGSMDNMRSGGGHRMGGHGGMRGGGMQGGGMQGGGGPGGEMGGEMGGGDMQRGEGNMPARENSASMTKKSFDIEFQLSTK